MKTPYYFDKKKYSSNGKNRCGMKGESSMDEEQMKSV